MGMDTTILLDDEGFVTDHHIPPYAIHVEDLILPLC